MKCRSIQQFAIVQGNSAQSFVDTLNAEIKRLSAFKPEMTFSESDPYFCRISYTETIIIDDEFADKQTGIEFRCEECPMFSPMLKSDGTEDRRIKYGNCPNAEFGRTYKRTKACDKLYQMIRSGEVQLCLAD